MEGAESILRKLIDTIAKEKYYEDYILKLKPISTGGANYTSLLYVVTLSSPNKKDLQLFAKVATLSEKDREVLPGFLYYSERLTYTKLMKKFRAIEDKHEIPQEDRFVVCKLYGFNANLYEETLVLEDLMEKGYTTYDRIKSIDWPYASKVVEVLAQFHALSIAYSEEYPEECQALFKELDGKLELAYKSIDSLFNGSFKMALEAINEENRDRLAKFFEDDSRRAIQHFIKIKRRTVLTHGDYRISNLMHKINEDGTVHVIPIDFQTIQAGCMLTDLIYFIFTGSDEYFRARYLEKLLEHYYNKLCHSLRAFRLDPEKLYPRKDFEFEYKETLPFGLICGVVVLPIATVEPEKATNDDNDDVYESLTNAKTGSTLYLERINGIVNDFIRWGII